MAYRKNFSAESRNLLQFNRNLTLHIKSDVLNKLFPVKWPLAQNRNTYVEKIVFGPQNLHLTYIIILFQEGWGYDFRRNMSVSWSDYGKYATDIFTDEAVKAINNHGNMNTTQPLFLYLAHLAVHSANTVQSQIFAYLVSLSKFSTE